MVEDNRGEDRQFNAARGKRKVSQFTSFERVTAALDVIFDRRSPADVASEYGVDEAVVADWVQQAELVRDQYADRMKGAEVAKSVDSESMGGISASLMYADRIRSSVLEDLRHRDSMGVCDHVYNRVIEKVRLTGDIAHIATQEVTSRIGKYAASITIILVVLGFFGLSNIRTISEDAARREVEARLKAEMPSAVAQNVGSIRNEIELFRQEVATAEARMRQVADAAVSNIQRTNGEVTSILLGTIERASADFTGKINQEIDRLEKARVKFDTEIGQATSESVAKLKESSTQENATLFGLADRIRKDLREEYSFLRTKMRDKSDDGDVAKQSPNPGTTRPSSDESSPESARTREVFNALVFRDYSKCLEIAEACVESRDLGTAQLALSDHFLMPDKFPKPDIIRALSVIRQITGDDPRAWDERQYQRRLELAIVLYRGGHRAESMDQITLVMKSPYAKINASFEQFVEAAIKDLPLDSVERLWDAALPQNQTLTMHGLSNSLFLLKARRASAKTLQSVQQLLIEKIEADDPKKLDATDYGRVYSLVTALSMEPVCGEEQSRELARRMIDRVFPETTIGEGRAPDNDVLGIYPGLRTFADAK